MKAAGLLSITWLLFSLLGNIPVRPADASPIQPAVSDSPLAGDKYGTGGGLSQYDLIPAPHWIVQEMIDQVDQESLARFVGDLSGEWPVTITSEPYTIQSRHSYSGESIQKSSVYLYEYYQAIDLQVAYQDFSIGQFPLRNVIAEIPGSLAPDHIMMISSHYDSAPSGPLAPGADDDASGTAAVMLAAQILSQYDFACTLRFVNFSGEEQGLVGSQVSAKQSHCDGENIRAVLNLDMIAWNTPESPAEMDLHVSAGVPAAQDIALLYQDVVETYQLDLEPEIVSSGISASDHASYWNYGFPAILVIEDLDDFNPYYHTPEDRSEQLDLSYFTSMVKASLATLAHMGCLVDSGWGNISGSVTDGSTSLPVPNATISFYHPAWDLLVWTTSDQEGRFNKALTSAGYLISADAPGYAPLRLGLVAISPESENIQDIVLSPVRENLSFLPLVQDHGNKQVCR
jgi:hypothetical protein